MQGFSVGVDIGGTFTDVVLIEGNGAVHVAKGISNTAAFEQGIFEVLGSLIDDSRPAADCATLVHGTTVATNAIIERKGALTGLITTKGFRDVLELRRIRIPRLYDLTWEKPPPLVERYLRTEVTERVAHDGTEREPVNADSVRAAVAHLKGYGVESLAVCLINAYANADHERQVRDIVREEWPGVDISLSSDILPEMREYERTSTTVINAYIMPVVRNYVTLLESGLRDSEFHAPLLLMQSNGGTMAADLACATPMHIIESGPAAGVVASQNLAHRLGIANALTLDIGGTTAKASVIENGAVAYSNDYEVGAGFTRTGRISKGGGYALRAPTLDISEIGAGGGSIVWIDAGGALQVGPRSAGANPGPACYGLGGEEPTLADACLVLGYMDPAGLAGGSLPLDRDAAKAALREKIAEPMGMDVVALAEGVLRIAVSNMTRAIRSVSTERGKDPRDFELIAFGGNGGLFAAAVARELGIGGAIVPPSAGIFSAFGLLYSDLEHHYSRTMLGRVDEVDCGAAEARWRQMEDQALGDLGHEGFPAEKCRLDRFGELRYVSQSHELRVPWPSGAVSADVLSAVAEAFEAAHESAYGHRSQDGDVELVNLHLVARGVPDSPRVPDALSFRETMAADARTEQAFFGGDLGWAETRVLGRAAVPESPTDGPVIVQEYDSTVLVPPDFTVRRDPSGNLLLRRK